MLRRMLVIVFCLVLATALTSGPTPAAAEEQQKKTDTAESKKDGKEASGLEDFREGINRAYDEFKKETEKGKKNLNDLFQRSTSTSKDEKGK